MLAYAKRGILSDVVFYPRGILSGVLFYPHPDIITFDLNFCKVFDILKDIDFCWTWMTILYSDESFKNAIEYPFENCKLNRMFIIIFIFREITNKPINLGLIGIFVISFRFLLFILDT